MTSTTTIVWERQNKVGKWCPYSPDVCQLLEQSYSKKLNSVCLGDSDILLKNYTVNLKDMLQVSENTGTVIAVRRRPCDEGSSIASDVLWQWQGDRHDWNSYSTDVADVIENTFKSGKRMLDLSRQFPNYPYKISFRDMVQKNKRTKYNRPIRRMATPPYPISNVENNIQEQSAGHPIAHSPSDVSDRDTVALGACAAKPSEKKFFMKHVNAFWNKLTKSFDSDSSASSSEDSAEFSANKKQCTTKNTPKMQSEKRDGHPFGNSSGGLFNMNDEFDDANVMANAQFATYKGNVWKYSWAPNVPDSELKPVPGIAPLPRDDRKPKKKSRKNASKKAAANTSDAVMGDTESNVIDQFTNECTLAPLANGEEQVCIICRESLFEGSSYDDDKTVIKLNLCSHVFHKSCVRAMYESGAKDRHLQCPTCKTIHGVKFGIQPPGSMVYHVLPCSLPGFPECDTIRIIYNIRTGTQGAGHPNPGQHYTSRGFPRYCYLPDNEMGRKVLRLLVQAWERRLIFTIGTSSTTGEANTVTWNEIHHKTEFGCNRHGHGFPDPNYFENIIAELAAHGVTESEYLWSPA